MLDINWNPSPRELRQFAGIWLPAFAAIAGTLIYRSGGVWLAAAIWAVGALTALVGVFRPRSVNGLFVGWMLAAYPIGWIVSHIVLGIVYFVLFTVVGLIMRAVRYDPLERSAVSGSYWRQRPHHREASEYFRQF
jgi:saxitoxin biosynthesis operon SxtJ-like protein